MLLDEEDRAHCIAIYSVANKERTNHTTPLN